MLTGDAGPQTKLELCLRSAEQRLVDLRLVGIKGDVSGYGIGVSLEDDLLIR
jgi:hypothetical protein